MKRRGIILGLGATTILAAIGLIPRSSLAQSQGDILEFIVDATTAGDIITGATGDVIVFIGRSQGTVAVGDCAVGDRPLQSAVAIDPGEQRATRIKAIIPTSQDTPVRPGTRVGNLQSLGNCNGATDTKFQGIVE